MVPPLYMRRLTLVCVSPNVIDTICFMLQLALRNTTAQKRNSNSHNNTNSGNALKKINKSSLQV